MVSPPFLVSTSGETLTPFSWAVAGFGGVHDAGSGIVDENLEAIRQTGRGTDERGRGGNGRNGNVVDVLVLVGTARSSGEDEAAGAGR